MTSSKIIEKMYQMVILVLTFMVFSSHVFAKGFSEGTGISEESGNQESKEENLLRTKNLIDKVEAYLKANDTYVAIIARRGAGNPETGVSDTDNLDLSGMAHCGFVLRNGFGKNSGYTTFNLVRMKGAKEVGDKHYDLSQLRVWSLPHFFIGTFEKDAIVFLPEKKIQLRLWNLLRANGQLKIDETKRVLTDSEGNTLYDEKGKIRFVVDNIITNGAFQLFHNPEYNLLSDYVEDSTQNCNEHLLKTYVAFKNHWAPGKEGYSITTINSDSILKVAEQTGRDIEQHFFPRRMVLSRTKSTFAFVQNIRFGERHKSAPTIFGLKLAKEKFDVVSVDSFCNPKNQKMLGWKDFKVFREDFNASRGWFVKDVGKSYIKVNRFTNQPNRTTET